MTITLEDVREQLAAFDPAVVGDWSDETITAVLAAEAAAQRSVLKIPATRPAALDQALMIRVLHNLATTNGVPLVRVGVKGEGVRELEAPYSRRSASAEPDPGSTKLRGSKPAAKKTAATTAATTQGRNS